MEKYILILLIICYIIYSKYDKYKNYMANKPIGDIGENIVANKLMELDDNYIVNHNVHYGKSQIDHIVVCPTRKSVFVIETKNWRGIITGTYNENKWIQNKNGDIKYLDNPIKQNQYHCSQVKKVYPSYNIYNIVVFINNRNVPRSKYIIDINHLVDYINNISINTKYYNVPIYKMNPTTPR
ncbi:nuclease-related domain-containing protein [Anaeromicropila herbilytica]|uniref:NERD domain-containing protein n=1 Tax=Anaeromicropila herbilytica TaxID=2785025 RepID=A0A7R7EK68_9FIRM|nr:nuclease-related domain-containing protein [Anaeromicropila herbilytica]BCN30279.1 hypothetical protein bsdtb5_15740 [Anaeromicropila herbilytica]